MFEAYCFSQKATKGVWVRVQPKSFQKFFSPSFGGRCLPVACALALFLFAQVFAAAGNLVQAAEPEPFQQQLTLSPVLSAGDADTYRKIFDLQSQGNLTKASALIAKLADPRLLGHVLSQRYLHTAYQTSFKELQQWMRQYPDYADASAIYRLAQRRQPKSGAALHRPLRASVRGFSQSGYEAGNRIGAYPPEADWVAGLAAWRQGQIARAGKHFAALTKSNSKRMPAWRKSATAYWAARAALAQRQPQVVNQYLRIAAQYPATMYGILAHRQLGQDMPFDWRLPQLTDSAYFQIIERPAVQRIVALAQAGQPATADKELLLLHSRLQRKDDDSLLALAVALELPSSQMRIAKVAREYGTLWQAALYPVPSWLPDGGFTAEPALLYAFMRQESKFDANAVSTSGARGLMQLMPATASFIGKNRALRGAGRNLLYDPELNMALGQRYIKHLLDEPESGRDLFALVVAYQAGPGTMARWRTKLGANDDPLLFIETIPRELTRQYLDMVVTDYWLYQARLGEAPRTLDALAAGQWPKLPHHSPGNPQARVIFEPALAPGG